MWLMASGLVKVRSKCEKIQAWFGKQLVELRRLVGKLRFHQLGCKVNIVRIKVKIGKCI